MPDLTKIKKAHIIGIGGSASSAIAELLNDNGITVTGSEISRSIPHLEKKGIKVLYPQASANLHLNNVLPDIVLYSPAVTALDPSNPELIEAKKLKIRLISWQEFIGNFLDELFSLGITASGSEGKGTTCGILTSILKGTDFDPLSILGAKIKNINNGSDSNIYSGKGRTYILEADEYNRNFFNYHPSINIMVNFKFEHPETYKNFDEYKDSFNTFFKGMKNSKILILHAQDTILELINEYSLNEGHKIILFQEESAITGNPDIDFIIADRSITKDGVSFELKGKDSAYRYRLNGLPGYLAFNAAGAIIAAMELGMDPADIQKNILNFKGMVRRFDLFKTKTGGVIITDYGHSPESINHIISEIRNIFNDKKIHMIFQPHLYSRTYNFFTGFIDAFKNADRVSVIDIFPAREKKEDWENKISSRMLCDALAGCVKDVFYAGLSREIAKNLSGRIDENEVTCFIGAGDMDLYYPAILAEYNAVSYFN